MSIEGEQREPTAFERWMAAASPARLWMTLLGCGLIAVCWIGFAWAVSYAYYYGWIWLGHGDSPAFEAEMAATYTGSTHLAVVFLLMCTGGFWAGAWIVTRFLHRQKFWSLVSPSLRISWRWFAVGVLIAASEWTLSWGLSFFGPGEPPRFNQPDMLQWYVFLLPVVALVFVQASGEELVFRGYLMQRLAARFRSPLIWILAPALIFGAVHYFNGETVQHGLYYVASTAIFGVTAAILVWRTGDLSAAIGWHVASNVFAILVSGVDDYFVATPLWLTRVEDMLASMPAVLAVQVAVLVFVMSPWGPKAQPLRRKDTRAAP